PLVSLGGALPRRHGCCRLAVDRGCRSTGIARAKSALATPARAAAVQRDAAVAADGFVGSRGDQFRDARAGLLQSRRIGKVSIDQDVTRIERLARGFRERTSVGIPKRKMGVG